MRATDPPKVTDLRRPRDTPLLPLTPFCEEEGRTSVSFVMLPCYRLCSHGPREMMSLVSFTLAPSADDLLIECSSSEELVPITMDAPFIVTTLVSSAIFLSS